MALVVRTPWTPDADIAGAFSSAAITYALLVPDSNYPSGGYPVSPGTFNLTTRILAFVPSANTVGTSNYLPVFDPTSSTLRLFNMVSGAWSEVTAGTDLSTTQVNTAILGW